MIKKTILCLIPLGERLTDQKIDQLLPLIPALKKKRLPAFYHWQDAQRTLLGYSLITYLLITEYQIPLTEIEYRFDDYGKPSLHTIPLHFNISHAGDWIACTVSPELVGVDVELIQKIDLSIADHFFAPEEVQDLMTFPSEQKLDYFFKLWTLKESYIKAEGKGVSIPLRSFSFHIGEKNSIQFKSKSSRPWRFRLYDFSPNYHLALCKLGTLPKQVSYFSHSDLLQL